MIIAGVFQPERLVRRCAMHHIVLLEREGTSTAKDAASGLWCTGDQGQRWTGHWADEIEIYDQEAKRVLVTGNVMAEDFFEGDEP